MPYSDKDYTVMQTREEIRILQLTDIHYDSSNDRKEDTIKLLKDTIERADADLITVTGDWCYMSLSKKKKMQRSICNDRFLRNTVGADIRQSRRRIFCF